MKIRASKVAAKIRQIAKEGLKHELHLKSSEGCMYHWFQKADTSIHVAVIAYNDSGDPVGVGVVTTGRVFSSMYWNDLPVSSVYVKPAYRKHGIGSKILKKLKRYSDIEFGCASHDEAGRKLYEKCGIKEIEQ